MYQELFAYRDLIEQSVLFITVEKCRKERFAEKLKVSISKML